jgi:hypothetical protein
MMRTYILYIVLSAAFIADTACNEKKIAEEKAVLEYGYLLIRNWDCAIKISFDTLGNGRAIKGYTSQYHDDPFKQFDTILVVDNFQIEKALDRIEFNRIIQEIQKGTKLDNGFIIGASHVELFIGEEKFANVYYNHRGPIDDLLQLIYPYVSFNIFRLCE